MNTTAIPVLRLQSSSGSRLAARLPDFVVPMKPRVMALAAFTALVGTIIAPGHLDPLLGSIAVLAIAAGPGAARCPQYVVRRRHRRRHDSLSARRVPHPRRGWTESASRTSSRPSSPAAPIVASAPR